MTAILGVLVFTGAFGLSVGVIALSIAPQWRRIARLATGHIEPAFTPLAALAGAERRIAVRRWASAPVPQPIRHLREAA
jgi:hypothetical protein